MLTLNALNTEEMEAIGACLAKASRGVGVIYLVGDLGAGKTTLCRGVLHGFGYQGAVKSPTYTLVEPYELSTSTVYHFDLYRVKDPEELEFMGIRDYFTPNTLCLIEWPERGEGLLSAPDISFEIKAHADGREIKTRPMTDHGQRIEDFLQKNI